MSRRQQQQEESIYNLVPRAEEVYEKQPRHVSKFKTEAVEESRRGKGDHRTMGFAKEPVAGPKEFLKKHEKEPRLPQSEEKFKYPDGDRRRPAVPKPDDQPMMGIRTTKNFIDQNATDVILSVPRKPQEKYVDTKRGDAKPLETSGLVPKYMLKEEFGQTPKYLEKRKHDLQMAREEYDNFVREYMKRGAMRELSAEDRERILSGLKANWEQLYQDYQGLSVIIDTPQKKNKKERLEFEMKQLEQDIDTLQRFRTIYITD